MIKCLFTSQISNYGINCHLLFKIDLIENKETEGILGLGFANRSLDDFNGLPGTEKEINVLKASYPGTFINSASKTDFLELSKDYDILHLAVHGRADSLDKYSAELIFSAGDQNRLKMADLYLASMNARLAVLSACESGIGVINQRREGHLVLRGALLLRGYLQLL